MSLSKLYWAALVGLCCAAGIANAEEAPLVDGAAWMASSEAEKEAYIIGAGNFMTVEYIVQSKSDSAPTDDQSSINRWWAALENTSINELVASVDGWYKKNPDELSTPVLVVIWNSYVETD